MKSDFEMFMFLSTPAIDGHNFGWGGAVSGDVDTAVSLMHRLRTLGIRAHFWI